MKLYAIVMLTIGAMLIFGMESKTAFKSGAVFNIAGIEILK